MRQFFKFMFASMLGFIISIIVLFFILAGILAGIASSFSDKEKQAHVKDNSVLTIDLDLPLKERTNNSPFASMGMEDADNSGLDDLLNCIRKAKSDDKIKGIFLNSPYVIAQYASLEEIRNALIDFKKSGKFIYSYAEVYSEGNYYLASVADSIYMNPAGEFFFNGMSANIMFMKNALEKLGVEVQVIRGRNNKFKGAVEPFILDKLSDENRKQIEIYVNSIYNHFTTKIAESRHMDAAHVREIGNKMLIQTPEDAVNEKMIDKLAFYDQVESDLKRKLGLNNDDKVNFINPKKYRNVRDGADKGTDKIAVIYAVGEINSGAGDEESIGSETMVKAFEKARNDKNVKAIVLRINSPGGSALASDVIAREVEITRAVKPVIVSMGDVAASGGYYIACLADTIVAQPNTITGSIGVFGLIPNAKKLLNEKMGLTFDGYKTGEFSDLGRIDRPLTEAEKAILQKSVDRIYEDFVKIVARGRNLSFEQVDSIGQGRVWTGVDALNLGLVDVIGGMDKALEIAAHKAGLDKYRIKNLPEQKDFFERLINQISSEAGEAQLKKQLGEAYTTYKKLQNGLRVQGIQARLPYDLSVE